MKTLILSILILVSLNLKAQFNIGFLDKTGSLHAYGGPLKASEELKSTDELGLYSKDGFLIGFDVNYIIKNGFGIGFNLEMNYLNFNKQEFAKVANADDMSVKGRYSSTKYGLSLIANIPIVIDKDNFTFNLFGQFNAGIRGFNIPAINLYYDELHNKYVEVNYRSRSNTMAYLAYAGGVQFIFANVWGVRASYTYTLRSHHSIRYSVRLTDAYNNVKEDENYLHNYLNLSGFQIGAFYLIGKK